LNNILEVSLGQKKEDIIYIIILWWRQNEVETQIQMKLKMKLITGERKGYKYTFSNIHTAYAKPKPGSTF
jgi:hypothetical protein